MLLLRYYKGIIYVTKYADGSSDCLSHGHDKPFINPKSEIITISLDTERSMQFVNSSDHTLLSMIVYCLKTKTFLLSQGRTVTKLLSSFNFA